MQGEPELDVKEVELSFEISSTASPNRHPARPSFFSPFSFLAMDQYDEVSRVRHIKHPPGFGLTRGRVRLLSPSLETTSCVPLFPVELIVLPRLSG